MLKKRELTYLKVDAIKPDPKNPRRHTNSQIRKLRDSIKLFGFISPLLLDRNNHVVAGHGRLLAAKQMGLREVPVIFLNDLSEAQVKAYRIADNRLAELSDWNDEALTDYLRELQDLSLDFPLDVTGFDIPEIDFRIQQKAHAPDNEVGEPLVCSDQPASRPGDLWLLGDHRLLQADARDPKSFDALLVGDKADMVLSDPPYNIPVCGFVSKTATREFPMASGEMSGKAFEAFLGEIFKNCSLNSKTGAILYMFMDWRHITTMAQAAERNKLSLLNICVWVKPHPGMGSLYRSQHELICVFRNGGRKHKNNIQLGRFGRNRSNVWEYASGAKVKQAAGKAAHPTIKPVALIADAMMDASDRGQLILDPFIGSGSTILAGERVGRRVVGLELDSAYVDLAIERWQQATGREATHASTQKTFSQMKHERCDEKV